MRARVPGASADYPPERVLRAALDVVRAVDAGAVARRAMAKAGTQVPAIASAGTAGRAAGTSAGGGVATAANAGADRIAAAVRRARLAALRAWRGAGQSR